MRPYKWAFYILSIATVYLLFGRMIATEMYKSNDQWQYTHGRGQLPTDAEEFSEEYFKNKALDILKFFHIQ